MPSPFLPWQNAQLARKSSLPWATCSVSLAWLCAWAGAKAV